MRSRWHGVVGSLLSTGSLGVALARVCPCQQSSHASIRSLPYLFNYFLWLDFVISLMWFLLSLVGHDLILKLEHDLTTIM